MIAQLIGKVVETTDTAVILLVCGVGYKINVTTDTVNKLKKSDGKEIALKTHLAVRETSMDLYGFLSNEELVFFEMLISISGIGPKSAIAILSVADVVTLKMAISTGESSYLTKVSGIGKKNAEKIILELRDKLGNIDNKTNNATVKDEVEAIEALQTLGYTTREAREAINKISKDVTTPNERIKEALKILGKQI